MNNNVSIKKKHYKYKIKESINNTGNKRHKNNRE